MNENMILAKSFKENWNIITLSQHTKDILSAFESIKDKVPTELHLPIKIAIFYHDFGKVIPKFQIEKLRNKNYEPFDIIYEIPHSLFSVFWIDEEKIKEILNDEKIIKFIISAVAYHHWRESFDDYIRTNEDFKKFAKKVLDEWKDKFEEKLRNEFGNLNINDTDIFELIKNIALNEKRLKKILNNFSFYRIAIPPYKFDYQILRETLSQSFEDQKKWILISGFLQRCDHFASFCEEEGESLDKIEINQPDFNSVRGKVKEIIKEDENKIWQIQKLNEERRNKNLILIAPTGYGKTEFAFLWSNSEKFIYTLPLRSAVNQIYERAKEIFGNEKVGLLYSDADIYLNEKEKDVGDTSKLYELAKALSFPAIISTGDQFFPYALRPPGYEKIFALFSYSRLVIDEVQAYDPKACAIVVSFIEWVYKMGGKFLLMSATMPSFVLNEIKKRIGNNFDEINIYKEEKENFQKFFKHKIKIELINNEEGQIKQIIEQAKNGKRVLVILNTVKKAQEIYEKLKENVDNSLKNKIFLIHSRFTLEDRREKETKLIEKEFKNPKPQDENEGKILVATQVVEASLDIDADVLFTEICPLDALIQRMGRVLRRYFYSSESTEEKSDYKVFGDKPNVFVWVFKNELESGQGKVYNKEIIRLSLVWLWKKHKDEILDIPEEKANKTKEELSEFFSQHFVNLIQPSQRIEQSSRKRKSKENENILQKIIENDEWINNINEELVIELSEYSKFKLVDNFYKSIPSDSEYIKEFYETLEVIDSSYMSEKRSQAQGIFREIYNVDVIIKEKLEEFKNEIRKFIKHKNSFLEFKKDILMKFIVSIPYRRSLDLSKKLNYKIDVEDEIWRKKLFSWLDGIYIIDGSYDEEKGLIFKDFEDDSIIY